MSGRASLHILAALKTLGLSPSLDQIRRNTRGRTPRMWRRLFFCASPELGWGFGFGFLTGEVILVLYEGETRNREKGVLWYFVKTQGLSSDLK